MPALEARDVSMRRCGRSLVLQVSLTAERGELLALCGPEGSGTRTLVHLLSGHLPPDAGRVLVDGRDWTSAHTPERFGPGPDPRRLAHGPEEASALLRTPGDASILLLERPLEGLEADDAAALLALARHRADAGSAVVLSVDAPDAAATHADTLVLFVAGRLLSWGAPPVALVPAVHIFGAGGCTRSPSQAGSIMTSST